LDRRQILKQHYIWGWPNVQSIADYIEKKNLSQKCGDLRYIEIIMTLQKHAKTSDELEFSTVL